MKKITKLCAGLLIGGVLATTPVALVGCGGGNASILGSTTDAYAFAGASTSMLASAFGASGAVLQAGAQVLNAQNDPAVLKSELQTAISQTLDHYMNVFDGIIGGKQPVQTVEQTSEKAEFAHKLSITVAQSGGDVSCTLYFNETLKNGGTAVENVNKEERETLLIGEMYVNDSQTPLYVEGGKEIDPQDNETEIFFKAFPDESDRTKYVAFEQEIEVDRNEVEEEYTFTIVNGNNTESFSFSLEKTKKGGIEVEFEQEINNSEIEFEIKQHSNGAIKIETNNFFGSELVIAVTTETSGNQMRYVYTIPALDNLVVYGAYH